MKVNACEESEMAKVSLDSIEVKVNACEESEMAKVSLDCIEADCEFKTQEVEQDLALQLLDRHMNSKHQHIQPVAAGGRQHAPQAERVKRPVLSFTGSTLEQEEYDHFLYQFEIYKDRLGGDQDSALLLRECLATDISRTIFSSYGSRMKSLTEAELLQAIVTCCVSKQTIQARINELHKVKQDSGQSVQSFLAALKMKGRQCDLKIKCSKSGCGEMVDYSEEVIRNLFIMGLSDVELQQDIMVVDDLTLDTAVKMAVAKETAKKSVNTLDIDQTNAAISAYKKGLLNPKLSEEQCRNCGEKKHKSKDQCPAADNTCSCGIKGHFKRYCFTGGKPKKKKEKDHKKEEESGNRITENLEEVFAIPTATNPNTSLPALFQPREAELASLRFCNASSRWVDRAKEEDGNNLHVIIKPELKYWPELHKDCSKHPSKLRAVKEVGLADTGASVTCAGPSLLRKLGLQSENLCPTKTVIRVASGTQLTVLGMIPATVQVVGHPDRRSMEVIYVAKEVKGMFISRRSLQELGCLPPTWPNPPDNPDICSALNEEDNLSPCGCPARASTPPPPSTAPFPITETEECRKRLQEWLLNHYSSSTFNCCPHQESKGMTGPPVKLAIKPDADLVCHTKPFKVPLHWKNQVKEGMERDVRLGIIEKLPPNTPAVCCHRMVVTSKPGSTKPRRTVDMSSLKRASYRLTHPGAPPFLEAQSVPGNTFKTVTDAYQGFHMIPLHPDSRKYTMFITEDGMFQYKRMPMGDHVSMDAYNARFDIITKEVEDMKRCVDDSLLYSQTLEGAFFQTAKYLTLMGDNGILQNPEKFDFGKKEIEWAGFLITNHSVKPLPKHTKAIRSFPTPKGITDMRSFTALLQQVAYCYAVSPKVARLRHLLKPSEQWIWDKETDDVFEEAREVIADKVEEGVRLFDPRIHTGLLTDWCQEGMGHILAQKHCDCPSSPINLNCCSEGWKVCSVGSRFCSKAESNYSPTEGEFTALIEGLEKTAYFTLGCESISVGTDHKPLIPIINGTDLSSVKTPRQHRLREKLLRWNLTAQYIPGKLLGGTDALSRYGVREGDDETVSRLSDLPKYVADIETEITWPDEALSKLAPSSPPISYQDVISATNDDDTMQELSKKIETGFPDTRAEMPRHLQPYWRVREMLDINDGVILMGDRIVVPELLRARVLDTLHSAHQGITSMRLRAEQSLYWPGMSQAIAMKRQSCQSCDITAPSQSPEPPITPETPEYPFQHVCSDYFSLGGHNFCLVVDRFSNWLQVYRGSGGSSNLITLLGELFHSFGIPESLTSDGGSQYIAGDTKEFLRKLGVKHRISSVGFPHSNQKAERSVGAAKRLLRDVVRPSGELDTASLIKGLLQLRNTPDQDTGLSPAQILLGRQLRDFLPSAPQKSRIKKFDDLGPKCKEVATWRELALGPRHARMHEKLSQGTKELPPLQAGDYVMIQNQLGNKPKQWDKRGVVVQAHPEIRQYKVMLFGSRRLSLRNRRFLRKYTPTHVPANAPLGLPKRLKPLDSQQTVLPELVPEKSPTVQAPVPARPPPAITLECDPGCCINPTQSQQTPVQMRTMEPVQRHVQPAQSQVPSTVVNAPEPAPITPAHAPNTPRPTPCPAQPPATPRRSVQVTPVHAPSTPYPSTCSAQPPVPAETPRRSTRARRGTTSKYDDFVQTLQDSAVVGSDMLSATQLAPPVYYTEPAYYEEHPAGMYNMEFPYDLVIFRTLPPGQSVPDPTFFPALVKGSGILKTPSTAHDQS